MTIGILLSGCGIGDGSQIEEVILTYLALDKYGLDYVPFAPNKNQAQVLDHLSESVCTDETRSVLLESARLGRGKIQSVDQIKTENLSALILPGGLGVFQNLSGDPSVLGLIQEVHQAGKPIGAMCAAVVLVAQYLGTKEKRLRLSTANNAHVESLRKHHALIEQVSACECVVDKENRIISTPAFLASQNLADLQIGIDKLVQELSSLL